MRLLTIPMCAAIISAKNFRFRIGGLTMALMQRMDLRQGQSLVMTPQLQQAIKLLQMSNLELQAYVEGELERNPLLERDERGAMSRNPKRANLMRTRFRR